MTTVLHLRCYESFTWCLGLLVAHWHMQVIILCSFIKWKHQCAKECTGSLGREYCGAVPQAQHRSARMMWHYYYCKVWPGQGWNMCWSSTRLICRYWGGSLLLFPITLHSSCAILFGCLFFKGMATTMHLLFFLHACDNSLRTAVKSDRNDWRTRVEKYQTCEESNAQKSRMQSSQRQALWFQMWGNVDHALNSCTEGQNYTVGEPTNWVDLIYFLCSCTDPSTAGCGFNQEHATGVGVGGKASCHLPSWNCSKGAWFALLQGCSCPKFWICSPLRSKKYPRGHFNMGRWCWGETESPFLPHGCSLDVSWTPQHLGN